MALVIEDGSGVAGANSYATLSFIRGYASARGITLTSDDAALEVDVIKAMDYLESKRAEYQGLKVFSDQSLQFPREGVYVDSIPVESTVVPSLIKSALAQLVIELSNDADGDIMPNSTGYAVSKTKVGDGIVETQYATGENNVAPAMPIGTTYAKVEALLQPLMRRGNPVRLVRI